MEEKKLELAIRRMVEEVNLNSKYLEIARKKNIPFIVERDYSSKNLGIRDAMFYLGYRLEEDGKRADREDGVGAIEYMHYKAVKDKELWK